jgi:phosphotransferase system HPr (HPr) family protein
MGFESRLWVGTADREVDAKSLLSILALGAKRGTELRLRAEGPDATAAIEKLTEVVGGLRE